MTNNYSILLEIAPEQSSVQILLFFLLVVHSFRHYIVMYIIQDFQCIIHS